MNYAYRNLLIFLIFKFGLMYLMRVWIRKTLKDMERNGTVLVIKNPA